MTAGEQSALRKAIEDNSLLSIRSLASNFPEDYDLAILSYAESNSVVEFIFEVYGNETMAQLLGVFAVGAQYTGYSRHAGVPPHAAADGDARGRYGNALARADRYF